MGFRSNQQDDATVGREGYGDSDNNGDDDSGGSTNGNDDDKVMAVATMTAA